MASDGDRSYHMQRVRAELDSAYRSDREDAAQAHMRLAALHMERLRQLDTGSDGSSFAG
ncbi:MAG TPA: hypothetical protein VF727_11720 [Allosphingosinicella sp.]